MRLLRTAGVALALVVAGLAWAPIAAVPAASSVLMVVGSPASLTSGDAAVRSRLTGAGYTVSVADDNTVTTAQADAVSFVLVTSSVTDSVLGSRLTGVTRPLWVAKPYLFDNYGLTGPTGEVDYGSRSATSISIVDPAHPMAAGRSGTVTMYTSSSRVTWGRAAASATVVARSGADATIWTIAAGAALATGSPAPGCRLSFPLFSNAAAVHTADGWALFDAATTWAANNCAGTPPPPPPPPSSSVLMVVGSPASLTSGDAAVRSRLTGAGYTVSVADDNTVTTAQADAVSFVLVTSSVTDSVLGSRLTGVTRPLWVAKPYLFDNYGLTGPTGEVDYGSRSATSISIVDPAHPMAAGRSGTVTMYTSSSRVTWGRAAASATVVARSGADATIWTIAAGAALATGSPAPGCRLSFPLFSNAAAVHTADGWALFDAATTWAANNCAGTPPPPPPPSSIARVVVISIDGLNPDAIGALGRAGAPTLYRLMDQGAFTLNARTTVERTQTLPNHASMVTGRRVALPGGHGVDFNEDNGSTIHASATTYVSSIFDVLHDAGRGTALYAGKDKFDFLDRSWDATNGAVDTTGVDNGRDKIDTYHVLGVTAATDAVLGALGGTPPSLIFLHYAQPDGAGHTSGWLSPDYLAALTSVDTQVGRILGAVTADTDLAGSTAVIVTTDHGGTGTSHADSTLAANYRVPLFVWGQGGTPGSDLYALNPDRADPGSAQPASTASPPPIGTGEVANLVTELLGLGAVPGSQVNVAQDLDVVAP